MKFALFTGCVAKGATRELMLSTTKAAEGLGFDFIEMKAASCCGAGVVSEKSPLLADALNARTFSIAEKQNLDIVTICSTCQGTLKKTEAHLNEDDEYKKKVNDILDEGGHQYNGKTRIKHFANILATEEGMARLKERIKRPLTGLKVFTVVMFCVHQKTQTLRIQITRQVWKISLRRWVQHPFIIPVASSVVGSPSS